MRFMVRRSLGVASWLLMSACLIAQEPAEDKPVAKPASAKKKVLEQEQPHDISYLPKQFSDIRTNILDLEQQDYFAVEAVDFRPRAGGDEAIVWTIRVKKTVTCRHVEAMLREYRDARFYSTIEDRRQEVLATLVYYSDRITLGASSNRLLGQDDVFEFWIELPTTYQQQLISLDVDTLALRRWKY